MRILLAVILLPYAVAHAAPSDVAAADAAYDAREYGKCGDLFEAIAARESGAGAADALYNAACCRAQQGKNDAAFVLLDRVVKLDFRDYDHAEQDRDLVSLHGDKRWPALMAAIKANVAAYEKSLGDPALRRELLAMVEVDQKARNAATENWTDKALHDEVMAVDRKNTARMKEIVAQKGWPTKALVGSDGAHAAWLLVQHADLDLPFQKLCLAKMEPLVKSKEVDAADWAYLVDRVAVAEKRKQTYGTQFTNDREPQPIEDEAHVDERRKSVGLGTLSEYKQQMIRMYGQAPKKESAPAK